MNITIPVFVHFLKDTYTVRPLFFPRPERSHEKLERVLHLLAGDLRRDLRELGKQPRHDRLAEWTFCPDLDYRRIDLALELKKRIARGRFFFVLFDSLGRRVAFTPELPDLWFELARGEDLVERATEVLTAHFRLREKEDEDGFVPPEAHALKGTAWITTLDLDVYPARIVEKDEDEEDDRASLGGDEGNPDGERELFRVGRCLDQLYPDDLDEALLRDREIEELTRLLQARDRRPVLILGPPLSGKTALLHEYVRRTVSRREERHKVVEWTWLLSPQRLISGMSYVGQWEKRLLAILKESHKKNHILYFDDFLGLYHAGRTSQSELCAADVMKPYIERREVRLLAEMTPEAFRVLRERDRGFADLFHVLPLDEPPMRDVLRILIAVQRQLEAQHRCIFDLDVLSGILDLERRYVRHLSFPGKAALFQRRLAVKYRRRSVTRAEVLNEFHLQSGLALKFLDNREKLAPDEVVRSMEEQVIGQPQALQACAEVVGIAKARLNDPDRPPASFLFLGPTGVGKTQCAKALARYLFGDAEKLLRFDMNEFNEPGSAARLVGTFFQPEGLLTAAIRRQPFAVVLLDEIEKADPEVFDLLLQLLGEGRLTDALGRTADFCNAIVILTSNLGVREASATLGYGPGDGHDRTAYTRAAERFFRPEFFNRLDRIIAFERLGRDDVRRIAHLLLADLLQREGLVRRKCLLRVEDAALAWIVDQGFDPVLGARALKRSLERQLAQPVARTLAEGIPEGLTIVHTFLRRLPDSTSLAVDVRVLEQVEPMTPHEEAERLLQDRPRFIAAASAAVRRIEAEFAPLRPLGEITARSIVGEHLTYFTVQEQLHGIREHLKRMSEQIEEQSRAAHRISAFAASGIEYSRKTSNIVPSKVDYEARRSVMSGLFAAQDIRLYLEELSAAASLATSIDADWPHALTDLAMAEVVAECCRTPQPEAVLVLVRSTGGNRRRVTPYLDYGTLQDIFGDLEVQEPEPAWRVASEWERPLSSTLAESYRELGLTTTPLVPDPEIVGVPFVVRGLPSWQLVRLEEGTHLFCPKRGNLVAVQVHVLPVAAGVDPLVMLNELMKQQEAWHDRLMRGECGVADEPLTYRPVRRIYNEGGMMIDVRTGLMNPSLLFTPAYLLAALPLPRELKQ